MCLMTYMRGPHGRFFNVGALSSYPVFSVYILELSHPRRYMPPPPSATPATDLLAERHQGDKSAYLKV